MYSKGVFIFLAIFCLNHSLLQANGIQYFQPATYVNPALLQLTQGSQSTAGVVVTNIYNKFSGSVGGVSGTVSTNNTPLFPYFLFSHRLSERVVGGLDVTHPLLTYITWPVNGFQAPSAINTIVKAYEITPKLSFSVTPKFALGISFRYLDLYNVQLSFAPLGFYLQNNVSGVGYGGSFGFWYMFNPKTFFDLSWFSPICSTLRGSSALGSATSDRVKVDSFQYAPNTFVANLTHSFTDRFLVLAKLAYSYWSPDKKLVARHLAAPVPSPFVIPLNWKNTWMASLFGRYQAWAKFAFSGVIGFDESIVTASYNLVGLPIGNLFCAGIGGEYRFTQTAWMKLMIGQARSYRPAFHNAADVTPAPAHGSSYERYSWADFNTSVAF